MKLAWLPFVPLLLVGCANQAIRPYLGKWNGGFVVDRSDDPKAKDLARNNLNGFLQLYGTDKKFVLHLNGEQEAIDATGTWTVKGNKATLQVLDVEIDDAGGELKRDPSKRYIPASDLRAAYQGDLVLEMSKDQLNLTGLESNIGSLVGHHEFKKVTNTYTY